MFLQVSHDPCQLGGLQHPQIFGIFTGCQPTLRFWHNYYAVWTLTTPLCLRRPWLRNLPKFLVYMKMYDPFPAFFMFEYTSTCTSMHFSTDYSLGLCWSRVPGLLPVSAASPSMDHEHGTVYQPILEHQIRPSAPSSVISRPTCFSSSLRCCWQVGSAPFVWRRCDCSASSAPFTNIQTYLLTYIML